MTLRIGLCGYARAGKDSICRALGLTKIAFADALKRDVAQLTFRIGLDPLDNEADKVKCRDLLVAYGALARSVRPDIWIERASTTIKTADSEHRGWCITDVRYANEVAFLHGIGATVVRIDREGYGPANDEERRSLEEIEQRFPDLPRVVNAAGKVEQAAELVRNLAASRKVTANELAQNNQRNPCACGCIH